MNQSSNKHAMRDVLAFLFRHWRREGPLVATVIVSMAVATGVDLVLPVFSGRLVDAIASHPSARAVGLRLGVRAIVAMTGLIVLLLAARYAALIGIIRLTLRLMSRFASDAFWRVQRFSTDWHANNFAGSIVRRITRGMWAVDLHGRHAAAGAAAGAAGAARLSAAAGAALAGDGPAGRRGRARLRRRLGRAVAGAMSRRQRGSRTRRTRASAARWPTPITCNAVVKSFGAEAREDARLAKVLDKWRRRTRRTWMCAHAQRRGADESLLLALRTAVVVAPRVAVVARPRDGGRRHLCADQLLHRARLPARHRAAHRNLQRSVNEMEEMVAFQSQPLGRGRSPRRAAHPRRRRARSSSTASPSATACRSSRCSATSRCASAPASAWGWSGIPAPARRRS